MTTVNECPKCGFSAEAEFGECPKCGIIVSKFMEKKEDDADETRAQGSLANAEGLKIKQQLEWGEILTGFETINKYEIMDMWGNRLYQAEEEGGSFATMIMRNFLTAYRPFTMHIFSNDGMGVYILKRPFRFWFFELDVCDARGMTIGKIQRNFALMRKIYTVMDQNGREIYQLFGPILRPWTFIIKRGEQELGKITKKWSGLAKESFTDADNFGVAFPANIDVNQKAILLGAVFLIDYAHFESKDN